MNMGRVLFGVASGSSLDVNRDGNFWVLDNNDKGGLGGKKF